MVTALLEFVAICSIEAKFLNTQLERGISDERGLTDTQHHQFNNHAVVMLSFG